MDLLALLKAIVGLASVLANYMNNKKLMDAGEALAILEGLEHAKQTIRKATEARASALADFDKRDGLPNESDPNLRD
jgi:hypothetical protein